MKTKFLTTMGVLAALAAKPCAAALPTDSVAEEPAHRATIHVHGTVRAKYEFQTAEKEGRFEVRNARVSLDGQVAPRVHYKAEADFSDEGRMRMLDAYARICLARSLDFSIGQMRVPFSIDAHRSPHLQYFANRSFIAKQVGDVRDVGATLSYKIPAPLPLTLQAGLFNGSGLTDQKDFWTGRVNFSAKATAELPGGFGLQASVQKIRPDDVDIMLYDGGISYAAGRWHIEAEYLQKRYGKNAFRPVHACNAFITCDIPLQNSQIPPRNRRNPRQNPQNLPQKKWFSKVSPLLRYDFMTNHSDGRRYLDGKTDTGGALTVTDHRRSRLTGGLTLSFGHKGFVADLRLNYEKYFYHDKSLAKPSERDKAVIEIMTHF